MYLWERRPRRESRRDAAPTVRNFAMIGFTHPAVFQFEKLPVCLVLFPALAVWYAAGYGFLSQRRQGEGLAFVSVLLAKTGGGRTDCK